MDEALPGACAAGTEWPSLWMLKRYVEALSTLSRSSGLSSWKSSEVMPVFF